MPVLESSYRVRNRGALTLYPCDDGVMIFDEATGNTYLFDHLSGAVLAKISTSDGSIATAALAAVVRELADTDLERLSALLARIEATGLVERC